MKDFLVVGGGLSASCLMHAFYKAGLHFTNVSDPSMSRSSLVAAGIYNPVVFKRLTSSWLAARLVPALRAFYSDCEKRTGGQYHFEKKILRPFNEPQEKKLWIARAKNELEDFLDPAIHSGPISGLRAINSYGLVNNSGMLDVAEFIRKTQSFFADRIHTARFLYEGMASVAGGWTYGGERYRNVIFCEGWLVKDNPYFHWVPMKPAKGEVLDISCGELDLKERILNQAVFIVGKSPGFFRVGATYDWNELNETNTEGARAYLSEKASAMLNVPFAVSGQSAAVRPASLDRRPLIGEHPKHKGLFLFNGMGTKGVMLCPYFSNNFVNFYLQKEPLQREARLSRYYHLYEEKA